MKKLCFLIIFHLLFYSGITASVKLETGAYPRLNIDGKPFSIWGGELGNSSASCEEDINKIFPKLAQMNLNTVLVPASWELIEPEEGNFDFSIINSVIDSAKVNDLKVVFLWFGAWKNSMSCYAPEWFKKDYTRFLRAYTSQGKPLEIASAFSNEVNEADLKAFTALLNHIKDYDKDNTVIMMQVENEIGMLEDARDHSPLANKEYNKGVPPELMAFLQENRRNLHPSLLKKWQDNGLKTEGSWKEVFGDDIFTDEYFMAWNYARYVEKLAKAGKEITDMPLYLNAAMNSRGRKPGEYPSAGPLAHLKDIWHAGAPSIDFLSPDIYDTGFEDWVSQYALPDNILFVPEVKRDLNNGAQGYYIAGHHKALGISPFSIENGNEEYEKNLSEAYYTLRQLTSVLTGENSIVLDGVLLNHDNPQTVIHDDSTRITLSHYFTLPWDSRASDKNNWKDTGAILIKISPDEYLLAGTGVVAKFEDVAEQSLSVNLGEDGFLNAGDDRKEVNNFSTGRRVGLAKVEEVEINQDGNLKRIRTFNGDETHQGRHVRISVDDNKILRIKTYEYK